MMAISTAAQNSGVGTMGEKSIDQLDISMLISPSP